MGSTLLFVLALVAGSQAGVIQEVTTGEQCSRTCTVSNQFNYESGTTYEYTYENEIRTTIQGASEDHAGFHLSATVSLEFLSKCEAVMRVKEVTLKEHDPETAKMKVVSGLLGKLLEEHPVRISYQDGNVEELCLSAPELPEVINIKKGILSAFQISMSDINKDQTVTEDDVSGRCETNYTSAADGWYHKNIHKSKTLLGCTDRHDYRSSVQGIPYNSDSKIQSMPLVKSTHECDHRIVSATGRLTSAMCQEKHILAPFSRNENGAVTHNTQKLSYVKEYRARTNSVPVKSRTTLKFDHANGKSAELTVKDLESKLMEICATTKLGVQPGTPSLFKSLVSMMKNMDSVSMTAVYKKIKSKTICSANNERVKKFFLDAIPLTGSSNGLSLMVEMLQDNEVTGLQADMWLTTLSFIQEPTMDMLPIVKPLISLKTNSEKAMLAVSSLVHSLCRNNQECENNLSVRKIISILESKIGNCKVSKTNFNTILYSLRAIGNAGFGTSAIPTLAKCIKIADTPIEIRLSAIEAFQRIPCTADRRPLVGVLADKDEDSEIRIAAYKSLMACPTPDIISRVKNILASEEVNQVGSYIWSHLTNLMETSDPHKQSIRAILEDEQLKKEFNLDNRKFSRNYEKSLFVEKLNTGVTAEGDLIWSSKSFIPRSAMVNLTVDLFGNSVNLFELGGRVEGLEYFLESYFGPNGYFGEQDIKAAEKAVDTIKADKSSRITKRMKSVMDELRGSMYMKVFGNELRYMHFQGLDSLISNNGFNIIDIMMNLAKENTYQFTHSTTFLDTSFIVPTSSGFPMNLTVNGTATIDLQASGVVDVMKMAQSNPNLDIHGLFRPSSAVEVSSSMSVDAFVTKIGTKMVSTMHSRTSVQGKITLTEEKALDVEFDLPEEQMDVFSFKSSFFTIHRDAEREQKMITENRQAKKICTEPTFSKITGLELCGEISFPNASLVDNAPYFPMTGPVKMGLTLYKRDSLSGYKLQAKSTHTRKENTVRFAFSTPGSKIDRRFSAEFNLNKADNSFESSFSSPWKRGDMKGTLTFTPKLKEINGQVNWDGSVVGDISASLAAEKSGPGMLYKPSLKVKMFKSAPAELTGTIKYAPWKVFDSEMTLTGFSKSPITVQASLMNKLRVAKASASIQLERKQAYTFDASVQKIVLKKKVNYKPLISIRTPTAEVFALGGDYVLTYGKSIVMKTTLDKVVAQPVVLQAKLVKKEYRRNRQLYNIQVAVKSKPVDIKLRTKLDNRNMKTIATDIDLTYVVRKVARDNIKFVSKVINLSSRYLTNAKMSMNFASKRNPDYNLKMSGNVNHNKKHSEIGADLVYGQDFKDITRQISLAASLDRILKSWSQSSVKFAGQFRNGKDLKLVGKVEHEHTSTSLDNSISFRMNGKGVSSTLKLADASKNLKNLQGNLEISIPGKTFTVSQAIVEDQPNQFTSTMNAQMGKYKNTILTKWEKPSPASLALSSEMNIVGMDPMYFATAYTLTPALYRLHAAYSYGKYNYSGETSAKYPDSQTVQLSADLTCPTRRVVATVEGKKDGDRLSTQTDLRWNADRDESERLILSGNIVSPSLKNIDGSIAIQHPAMTLGVNLKHSIGSKYASKLEVQVDNQQFFFVDTTFGSYAQKSGREVVGTVDIKTQLRSLRSLNIMVNHEEDDSKYETKLDIKWNPNNVLSSTLTVKRPLSSNLIDIELIAKTPFQSMKTVQASLMNKIKDGMFTVAKLDWNRQSIQMDVTLANRGDAMKTDIQGQIDLKTSFKSIKFGTIKVSHAGERGTYTSGSLLKINKKEYGIESTMTHRMNGWNINNNGKITVTTPAEKIVTKWNHDNTMNDVTTSSEMTWGNNKRAFVKYSALQNFGTRNGRLSSALEMQLPFKNLGDIVFQINHEHKPGQFGSSVKLESERTPVIFANAKYLNENDEIKSDFTMTNPLSEGTDIAIKITSVYAKYPMSGHVEMTFSPSLAVTADASFDRDTRGNADMSVTVSIPAYEPLTLTGSRVIKSEGVQSKLSLQYAPNMVIDLETVHKLGTQKVFTAQFTSPFTETYSSEMTLSVLPNSFRSTATVEAEPFISKLVAEIKGSNNNGLSGNVKVSTKSSYCQASILSELVDGERRSSAVVEYQPGKTLRVMSKYDFGSIYDWKMFVEVSTPFKALSYSSINLNHRGGLREFTNNAEFAYNEMKKLQTTTSFSTRKGLEGTLSIKTPFMEPASIGFSHSGNWNKFNTHVEVAQGTKYTGDLSHQGTSKDFTCELNLSDGSNNMKGSIRIASVPKLTSQIVIETPFKGLEEIRMTSNIEGSLRKFTQDFDLFISSHGAFKVDSDVNLENPLSISLNLKTPIKGYSNMAASLSHVKSSTGFESQMNIRKEQQQFGGSVKLNSDPAYTMDVSMQTPYRQFRHSRVLATLSGQPNSFRSNVEVHLNKDISEMDLSFSLKRKLDIDFSFKSPYTDRVKASIDHRGKWNDFNTKLRIRSGRDVVLSDVRFQLNPSLDAYISLRTPFPMLRNHQFSVNHTGNRNSFKCNMDYKFNKFNYNGDFTFQNLNTMKAELNFDGSTLKPFQAIITHDGSIYNFKSSGKVSVGKKVTDVRVSLKSIGGLKSSIQIETPFKGYEMMDASYSHTGQMSNFRCQGEASLNRKRSKFDLVFDISRDVSVSITMKTPFAGFTDVSSSLTHAGSLGNFNTALLLDKDGKTIEGSVMFSNARKITSMISLRSTFPDITNTEMTFDHDGTYKRFNTHAKVQFGRQKSDADISIDFTNGYNGKVQIATPSKTMSSSFDVATSESSVSSSADITIDEIKMFDLKSVLSTKPSISATLSLKTPIRGLETSEFTFNHDGQLSNFRTLIGVAFLGETGRVEVTFENTDKTSGVISAQSTLFNMVELTMSKSGTPTNFNSQLECLYNRKSQFLTEATLNLDGLISGTFKIISPIMRNIKASFNHQGRDKNFNSGAELIYAGKKGQILANLNMDRGIDGSLLLVTPFTQDIDIQINSNGPITDAISTFKVMYGGDSKFDLKSEWNLLSSIKAGVTVQTPLEGFRQMMAKCDHRGNMNNFETEVEFSLERQVAKTNVQFSRNRGKLSIQTPFTEEIDAVYTFDGQLPEHTAEAKITFGAREILAAKSNLAKSNADIKTGFSINSPVIVPLAGSLNVTGRSLSTFSVETYVTIDKSKHEADITFENSKDITGRLGMRSAYFSPVSTSFTLKGSDINRFSANIIANFASESHEIGLDFTREDETDGSISVKSPLIKSISCNFNLKGNSVSRFEITSIVTVGSESHEMDVSFKKTAGSFSVRSPLLVPVSGKFNVKGYFPSKFQASSILIIDSQNHEIDITFRGSDGSFSVSSPLVIPLSGKYNLIGNSPVKFEVASSLSIDSENHEIAMSFNGEDETRGSFSLQSTAVSPVSISFSIIGDLESSVAIVEATVDTEKHTVYASFNKNNGLAGSMKITSPLFTPISGNMEYKGTPSNFESNIKLELASKSFEGNVHFTGAGFSNFRIHLDASVNRKKIMNTDVVFNFNTAMEGSVNVFVKDISGRASFEHTGQLSSFKNVIAVEFNSRSLIATTVSFSKQSGTLDFTIKMPVKGFETMSGRLTHTGNKLNFKNHGELDIAGKKTEVDLACNFGSKLEARISASSPFFPSSNAGFDISTSNGLRGKVDLSLGDASYALDGFISTNDELDAEVSIQTPIEGYRKVVAKMTNKWNFPEVQSMFDLKTGRRTLAASSITLSKKVARFSAQSIYTPVIQFTLGLNGKLENFNSNAELRVNGKPFTTDIVFKSNPIPTGSLSISTPYTQDISGTFEINFVTPSAKFTSVYGKQVISGYAASLVGNNELGGKFGIKSPFVGFEDLNGLLKYVKMYKGIKFEAELDLANSQKIEFETSSRWNQGYSGSIDLKTPYAPLTHTSGDFKLNGQFPNVKSEVNVMHSGERFTFTSELNNDKTTSADLKITTPVTGFESMGLTFNHEGTLSDMVTKAKVILPYQEKVSATFTNVMTSNQLVTKASLDTPFTEDILSIDMELSGVPTDFKNSIELTMGNNAIISKTGLKLDDRAFNFETTLSSLISGVSDEQKAMFKYALGETYEVASNIKLFGSVFSLDSSLELSPSISGVVSMRTPFPGVQDVRMTFSHSGSIRQFNSKATLQLASAKVIDGSVFYEKYGWRRLHTSAELKTPFIGFETNKIVYTHSASVDSFECDGSILAMEKSITGNLKASISPMSAALVIKTPFEHFEQVGANMKLNYGSMFFNGDASVTYMKDNTVSINSRMDMTSSPKTASLRLSTPFRQLHYADVSLTHSGNMNNFQSVATITAPYIRNIRAEIEGKISSLSDMSGSVSVTSQIKNFESLKLNVRNSAIRARINSRIEASWSPSRSIIVDSSMKNTKTSMSADITVSTPFETLKTYNLKTETNLHGTSYSNSLFSNLNGFTNADLDLTVDTGSMKKVALNMRAPMPMDTLFQGEKKYNTYSGSAVVSVRKLTYTLDSSFDTSSRQLAARYQCPENKIQLDSTFSSVRPKADLTINGNRYGYDFLLEPTNIQIKAVLPSRSLMVSGSQNARTTEGSFMWDADKDETKKIGFRSILSSSTDSSKADVTLMMPSLGKDVQIDSEMILNRGRVIFDGKTEFSYSQDSRKRFTLTSRLADISNDWSSKNYSFSLGISHPYSSIGVQVKSHLGKSASKFTGGMDVEYLTVTRETKTFSVNGELDRIRKTVDFEMVTPVKTVAVSGSASTNSPFSVAFQNKYDNRRPLTTRLSINPNKKSINFQMNYDLDNPDSEFHLNAMYVNKSAVKAEMYHVVNRQKITDLLTTVRLNNSHLLHSRLHWRPTMMNEFMDLVNRKSAAYNKQTAAFIRVVSNDVESELSQKYRIIAREVANEMDFETFKRMYNTNQYHVKDMTDAVSAGISDIKMVARDASVKMLNVIPDMGVVRLSKEMAQVAADNYNKGIVYIAKSANSVYNSGVVRNLTERVSNINLSQKYNDYMNYMYKVNSFPKQYLGNSYIRAGKDGASFINARVNTNVMQQGRNAYKYWEVSENTQKVFDAIVDWIKEEIDTELSDIKATLLGMRKDVTVFDPEHGEIQVEIHLPFPVKSLEDPLVFDVTPFLTKVKKYTPSMPSMSLPSTDISSWIPPFDAYASIERNTITTFDGLKYDLSKECTFVLARDFVNGNFSAVLHNGNNGKSVIVLTRGMSIDIRSNGTVIVNGIPTQTTQTFSNGVRIQFNGEGHVTVDAAGSFEISYNKDTSLYSFRLNGWYFNKVAGLFGTFDNEPTNDLMTSYGKHINNSDRFASTWDIGTAKCR